MDRSNFYRIISTGLLLIAMLHMHAQKKSQAEDSIYAWRLIGQTESLTVQASYDSAIAVANQVLQLSRKSGLRNIEAHAYDRLSEIMLLNGKMSQVRHYDSLVIPIAQQY